MISIRRYEHNPILKPGLIDADMRAAFNLSPIRFGKSNKKAFLYRGEALPVRVGEKLFIESKICVALPAGKSFTRKVLVEPSEEWDRFGCEDARVTKLPDGRFAIFYTALSSFPFSAEGIKVGVAITRDFETIEEKHLVTPFNAKAMILFPEKVNGKIAGLVTINPDIPPSRIIYFEVDSIEDLWNHELWAEKYGDLEALPTLNLTTVHTDHIEIGSVPIKTRHGWLLVYSRIQNYADEARRVFGIHTALLSLKNPQEVAGDTRHPLMVPEEQYELYGNVPRITFPSGAEIEGKTLNVYYSAADTVGAMAQVNIDHLFEVMLGHTHRIVERSSHNPIIVPDKSKPFEALAVFNPATVTIGGKVHMLYRSMSRDNTSYMGYAVSKDGIKFIKNGEPAYEPRESFERKGIPGGNSGAEDPRITLIDGTLYVCYTGYNGLEAPRVALVSISEKDFIKNNWKKWSKSKIITPQGIDDKDACIFPEKIRGKYHLVHRIAHNVCLDPIPSKDLNAPFVVETVTPILKPRIGMWDSQKVGLAGTPLKTKKGWVFFYHGIGSDKVYRLGAALLSLKDPYKVIARTDEPIFEPELSFEKRGQVGNVVFPTGFEFINKGKTLHIYYGAADSVIGVATVSVARILDIFEIK